MRSHDEFVVETDKAGEAKSRPCGPPLRGVR